MTGSLYRLLTEKPILANQFVELLKLADLLPLLLFHPSRVISSTLALLLLFDLVAKLIITAMYCCHSCFSIGQVHPHKLMLLS